MQVITFPGRFPGLNEYISVNRANPFAGAALKKKAERSIMSQLETQLHAPLACPLRFSFHFYEANKRRDKDNISGFFHKCFFDSLVKSNVIPNDSWDYIDSYSDSFDVDSDNPRISVTILEHGDPE